jgi:DNA mismatch repair protein MutL
VIERIAAGEVIERPASVVRELIENALDAGATSVRIEVREGGLRLLRVSDDGTGIASDDLELACQPHATSKVRDLDDLTHITTLGFRGEALASIAAVAEIEIASAMDASGLAAVLTLSSGRAPERGVVSRPRGTMVTVRQLFAEVPARRALLRGPAGESARVAAVVRGYALAHPAIRFTLIADGAIALQTAGDDLTHAVAVIYGADVARSMLPIGPLDVDGATLEGVVSARGVDAPDRSHVLLVVNGRPVANQALLAAMEAGYRPLFRKGRHPLLLAKLALPPDALDVNVHPAKAEVLLRSEQALAAALRAAIHKTLGTAPTSLRMRPDVPPTAAGSPTGGFFAQAVQLRLPAARRRRGLLLGERRAAYRAGLPADDEQPVEPLPELEALGQLDNTLILARAPGGHLYLVDQHRAHERILYEALVRQAPPAEHLTAADLADAARSGQGAAQGAGQLLLMPVLVELTPTQARLLNTRLNELAQIGLECQPFGGSVFLVRSLPSLPVAPTDPAELARALAQDAAEDADDWRDHLRISLACRSAIRRGQPLAHAEQATLLSGLRAARTPAVCPHGSPLLLRYSQGFLARAFEW